MSAGEEQARLVEPIEKIISGDFVFYCGVAAKD